MRIYGKILAIGFGFCAPFLAAVAVDNEVIVESRPVGSAWSRTSAPTSPPGEPWLALRTQLESAQREVQVLQGVVEDLQHQMNQLRVQQQSLYQDLDARLNTLSAKKEKDREKLPQQQAREKDTTQEVAHHSPRTAAAATPKNTSPTPTKAPVKAAPTALDEKGTYDYAYDLLQHREYLAALEQFKALLSQYPGGQFTPNAHYWMGEIYLLGGDMAAADKSFATVVEKYPAHTKAADALLKRGNIQYADGHWMEARACFNDVKARFPDTAAARLAEARLIQMKQDNH